MATRTEKVASRIAGGVRKVSKSAAGASRRLADALDGVGKTSERVDSPRKFRRTKAALTSAAKAAAVGVVAMGARRVAKAVQDKADALEAGQRRRNRIKTAAKVAGAAAVVAGAMVLSRRGKKK